jgi:hypothetical protein
MVRPKRWQAIFEPGHRAQLRQAGNSLLIICGPALFWSCASRFATTLAVTITSHQGVSGIVMLRGMAQMDLKRRLKAHRMLSLTVSFLALAGWGTFAYSAGSSARAQHQLREEVVQLKAAQDRLLAARTQQQEAWGDLSQLQAKLASARQEIAALAQRREQAKAQVASAQQDLTALVKRLDDKRARVSEARKVRVTEPSSRSSPGQTKSKTWRAAELVDICAREPSSRRLWNPVVLRPLPGPLAMLWIAGTSFAGVVVSSALLYLLFWEWKGTVKLIGFCRDDARGEAGRADSAA